MAVSDLADQAIAELYSGDLDGFIQRRRDLAASARAAGDRAAARTIAGLGKPTRSAWIVNRLVHADPAVPARLAELGDRLRAGEAALDGASIRELSLARRELIDTLVRRALAESGERSASATLREEVTDTFSAALADPQVAEQVAAGRLVRAARWAGFGPGIGTAIGQPAVPADQEPAGAAGPERAEREQREHARRAAIADAEQEAAAAASAAEAAAATERELAESVRFLTDRLQRDQQHLVQARRDARQAAADLTRARQARDRLRRRPL